MGVGEGRALPLETLSVIWGTLARATGVPKPGDFTGLAFRPQREPGERE